MTNTKRGWSCHVLWLLTLATLSASSAAAQSPPSDADVFTALRADVHTLVTDLAAQRDAVGGWPAAIDDAYANVQQLETQLGSASSAGDAKLFRKRYRNLMRVAARITRWLANKLDPSGDQVPLADRLDAVLERLSSRVEVIKQVASKAGVTLTMQPVDQARAQVESARTSGTQAQLRAAVKNLRDAIDGLQNSLPDPDN